MLPEFPEFKEIEITDRAAVERCLAQSPRSACEFSFANLCIWRDFDRPRITIIEGNLCILIEPLDEPPFFLEPIGNGTRARAISSCMGHAGRISRATSSFISSIPAEAYSIARLRDHFDYIYRSRDLAELKGRRYDGKRNHIKAFERCFPRYEFIRLTRFHRDKALRIFNAWADSKKANGNGAGLPDLAYDCQCWALNRAFEGFDEIGLIGCGIATDGKLQGFLLASQLSAEMACIHLEYHLPDLQGIAQTLLWEACCKTLARFEYVNLEQDLGIAGLRRHKESYYPMMLEEKFDVVSK